MRRVLWRVIVLGVVITLGVTAAFLAYVQTGDGFRRVVVPLAASLLGGHLTAERGRLGLDGELEIERGTYRDETAGIDLAVSRLVARVAPLSLVSGERPRIELLEIGGLRLTIDRAPATPETAAGGKVDASEGDTGSFTIPVRIDEARVRGAHVVVRSGAETTAEIGPLDLDIRDLGPGVNATLALDGSATHRPGKSGAESVTVRASARLEQDAAGSFAQGKLEAALGLVPKAEGVAPLDLKLGVDASAGEARGFDFELQADATSAGADAGHLAASGRWPAGGDPLVELPSLKATVEIGDAARLDSILTLVGWNLFSGGRMSGEIEVAPPAGDASAVKVRIDGERLSARLENGRGSTPPLTLSLLQEASWSPARKQLRIDALSLRVTSQGGGTIDSALDGKLLVDLDSPGASAAAREEPAVWTTKLAGLDLVRLDAWLGIFGSHVLDGTSGKLGGNLRVDVAELGGRIAAAGTLGLEGFRMGKAGDPIDVTGDVDVTMRDLERVEFSQLETRIAAENRRLFVAKVNGTYDLADGSGQVEIGLDSEDLANALARLAILPPEARQRIHGGRSKGNFQAKLGPATEITGAASIDALEFTLGRGVEMRQNLRTEVDLKGGDGVVDFRKLVVNVLDPATTTPATLTLSGAFPSASQASVEGTELKLEARGLAVGHWIETFGGPTVASIGSVPLEGDLTLRRAAGESRLTLSGEERVVLRSGPAPAGETIEVTAKNTVEHLPGEATKFSVDLSTNGASRAAGHLTLEGALGRGGEGLRLDANIHRLTFGEVEASSGRVRLDRSAGRTTIEVAPTQIAGGRIEGRLEHHADGGRALSWSGRTHEVDVGRLYRTFVGDRRRVEGILDLETNGTGTGRDADHLRQSITGGVEARMAKARFAGTPMFTYLAKVTGITQFEDVVFDSVVADIAIGDGVARIRHMEGSGLVANIEVTGQATLTGDVDLKVNPRVGPSLSGSAEKIFAVGLLVKTASDFVALPIDVTVRGPYDDPKFGVVPRVPGALDKLTGTVAGEAAGAVVDTGKVVGGGVIKGVGGILKEGGSLFGRRKR